jgi:hypothetical protein
MMRAEQILIIEFVQFKMEDKIDPSSFSQNTSSPVVKKYFDKK